MLKRCASCKGKLEPGHVNEVIPFGDQTVTLTLPARRCTNCGETFVAGEVAERADLYVAAHLPELGIGNGEAFRFMRKALGLRAVDLAALLAVDVATLSRWETGKVPVDRCALTTLAAAASERLEGRESTIKRLRVLSKGRHTRSLKLRYDKAS